MFHLYSHYCILKASSKALLCIDCSPITSLLVTGSSDRHVRMWDCRVKGKSLQQNAIEAAGFNVQVASLSPVNFHQIGPYTYSQAQKIAILQNRHPPLISYTKIMTGHHILLFQ